MKAPLIAAGIIAAAALGPVGADARPLQAPIATPAIADIQTVHHTGRRSHHVLPKRAVVRSLYRRGYREVHRVHYRNGYWRARALGRRGVVALKIDPRNGHIIKRRVVRHYDRPNRHRGHSRGNGSITFSFGFH